MKKLDVRSVAGRITGILQECRPVDASTQMLAEIAVQLARIADAQDPEGFPDDEALRVVRDALQGLTPEQRVEFFTRIAFGYCIYCGCDAPKRGGCQCRRDE